MVPPLSSLSLALCHEALEGGGNHKMETSIAKKKLPLLLTSFTIHCLTKSFRFLFPNAKQVVPYCNFLVSRNCIMIYGAKPMCAPENLDSFASLTLYVCFAHSLRLLRSLSTFASLTPYARFARYPNSLPA